MNKSKDKVEPGRMNLEPQELRELIGTGVYSAWGLEVTFRA